MEGNEYTGSIENLKKIFEITDINGNWVSGKLDKYQIEIKLFATGSEYGINGGRISKFSICDDKKCVLNYDRGWDKEPKRGPVKKLLDQILQATEA